MNYLGKKAQLQMDKGEEVISDDIINNIIKGILISNKCRKGFILNGYPKNINQMKHLNNVLSEMNRNITHLIFINVSYDELKKRFSGRWVHKKLGRSYHSVFNHPQVKCKDAITGEYLMQRKDDNEQEENLKE